MMLIGCSCGCVRLRLADLSHVTMATVTVVPVPLPPGWHCPRQLGSDWGGTMTNLETCYYRYQPSHTNNFLLVTPRFHNKDCTTHFVFIPVDWFFWASYMTPDCIKRPQVMQECLPHLRLIWTDHDDTSFSLQNKFVPCLIRSFVSF